MGLVALTPLFLVVGLLIRVTSRGPVFFRQRRMGRNFQTFQIYKFRTMVVDAPSKGAAITADGDPRVTAIGRFLRKSKFDELPQLLNVLKGEMSLVGPRPEVPKYVEQFREEFAKILSVRPGITDLASLEFRHEEEILARAVEPEREYVERVLPAKLRLSGEYVDRASFLGDLQLILRTVTQVLR